MTAQEMAMNNPEALTNVPSSTIADGKLEECPCCEKEEHSLQLDTEGHNNQGKFDLPPKMEQVADDERSESTSGSSTPTSSAATTPTASALDDTATQRKLEQAKALQESEEATEAVDSAWNMFRKGAVATAGGTLVGLGLVLIPLPIPLGIVTASAGMAMLSTEFEQAKEVNDRVVKTAKHHSDRIRDHMIQTIERMDSNANSSTSTTDTTKEVGDNDSCQETTEQSPAAPQVEVDEPVQSRPSSQSPTRKAPVVAVDLVAFDPFEPKPSLAVMNEAELKRQEVLRVAARKRLEDEAQQKAKEQNFFYPLLSKHVLPILKRARDASNAETAPAAAAPVVVDAAADVVASETTSTTATCSPPTDVVVPAPAPSEDGTVVSSDSDFEMVPPIVQEEADDSASSLIGDTVILKFP